MSTDGETPREPVEGVLVKSRRRLPHWELPGSGYFLTWRCVPGLALEPPDRDIVAANLRHWEGKRYLLFGAVVMPDHVHALLKPLQVDGRWVRLSSIVRTAKGYTSRLINVRHARRGPVWQEERFDRIVRDQHELTEKLAYMRNNPVRWELAASAGEYRWFLAQKTD